MTVPPAYEIIRVTKLVKLKDKQDQGDLGQSQFLSILITIWTDLEQIGTIWTIFYLFEAI